MFCPCVVWICECGCVDLEILPIHVCTVGIGSYSLECTSINVETELSADISDERTVECIGTC